MNLWALLGLLCFGCGPSGTTCTYALVCADVDCACGGLLWFFFLSMPLVGGRGNCAVRARAPVEGFRAPPPCARCGACLSRAAFRARFVPGADTLARAVFARTPSPAVVCPCQAFGFGPQRTRVCCPMPSFRRRDGRRCGHVVWGCCGGVGCVPARELPLVPGSLAVSHRLGGGGSQRDDTLRGRCGRARRRIVVILLYPPAHLHPPLYLHVIHLPPLLGAANRPLWPRSGHLSSMSSCLGRAVAAAVAAVIAVAAMATASATAVAAGMSRGRHCRRPPAASPLLRTRCSGDGGGTPLSVRCCGGGGVDGGDAVAAAGLW